jgi:hypothetical protein
VHHRDAGPADSPLSGFHDLVVHLVPAAASRAESRLSGTRFLVAVDERNMPAVYDASASGAPMQTVALDTLRVPGMKRWTWKAPASLTMPPVECPMSTNVPRAPPRAVSSTFFWLF